AYSSQLNTQTSSMPTMEGALHWYAPVAWLDEEGNRVYVDAEGNPTDTDGEPGWRFPMSEFVTKEQTYMYKNSFTSQRHTFNAYSTYNLNLNDQHDFKFMLGSNIVGYKFDS